MGLGNPVEFPHVALGEMRRRVIVKIHPYDDTVKRQSSGIFNQKQGSRHHFRDGFAGELHVERIRA